MRAAAITGCEWRWRAVASVCLLAGLSACSARPPLSDLGPSAAVTEPSAQTAASAAEGPAPQVADPAAPMVAAVPSAAPQNPARLVGTSHELLRDLLGQAAFVRRDGPVQIWRYAAEDCFLDIFLFRDSDNVFRVHHVDARSKGAARITVPGCYGSLVAARRAGRG